MFVADALVPAAVSSLPGLTRFSPAAMAVRFTRSNDCYVGDGCIPYFRSYLYPEKYLYIHGLIYRLDDFNVLVHSIMFPFRDHAAAP